MENNSSTSIERARDALFSLSSDVPREDWIELGMSAKAAGLSLEDFLEWSSQCSRFVDRDARAAWKSFRSDKGLGPGTLFHRAQAAGWNPNRQKDKADAKTAKAPAKSARKNAAARIWEQCIPLGQFDSHPYIERKNGVKTGLRVVPQEFPLVNAGVRMSGALVVPIYRLGESEPTSLQFISDGELAVEWKVTGRSSKLNLAGAPIEGVFVVGDLSSTSTVYLTEGVGQAWSCWQATGCASVVCFGWSRVRRVILDIRAMYPNTHIVVLPDAGLEQEAEKLSTDLRVSYVPMPEGWPRNSDINDLARREGIKALEELLAKPRLGAAPDQSYPLDLVFGDELPKQFVPPDELVEGLLVQGECSMIFGDSNSGKTFTMIDMAAAITRGTTWMGRKTEQGIVVYLATESPASVKMRLQGYMLHNQLELPNFVIVQTPINLFDSDDDTNRVVETVKMIEAKRGIKVRLIIGDTLARLCAGANENAGQDMSLVLKRVGRMQEQCTSAINLIHHVGKNFALGARGWSGVRAFIDTELEVISETSGRCMEVKKQRDLGSKGTRIGFDLKPIYLGESKWGAAVSTCVVQPADAPEPSQGKRRSEIEGALVEFLKAQPAGMKKALIVEHFDGQHSSSAIYREIKKLVQNGRLHESVGIVSLAGKKVPIGAE